MAKAAGIPPAFLPWSIGQIHATLSDDDFLEAYYKLYASIDSPSRRPWTREHFVPDANFHRSCRLGYVAEPVRALSCIRNTEAGKQPSETVDTMEFAWCPRMARLTLTVTTDMLVKTSGAESQAVRVWAKQWSFTASGGADETSGCIVLGTANSEASAITAALRQVKGLISLLKSRMTEFAACDKLISRQEAEALMTVPPPSSPQSSSGSPGAPQHMSKPSHDFLRTGVTPQEDIKPLIANPGDVLSGAHLDAGRPDQRDGRLSASDYEALRTGQGCRPLPHVEASEAARVFHAAGPRARMAQVLEETPMPLPAPTTAQQGWQTPQEDEGATRQADTEAQSMEKGRKSPVSVMWEPVHGISEPGSPGSGDTQVSTLSPECIRVCLSPGGHRSILETLPEVRQSPRALSGPLHFRASIEDGINQGGTMHETYIPGDTTHHNAFLPQLPKPILQPETPTLPHGVKLPPLSSQMATYPDPAQALTIVMEVAVETVNNVAQIAMETLQKMSAITIEQLNNAEQQPEEQRMPSVSPTPHMATPPPCMQRPSYTRAGTLHCERSATKEGHGAKFWDVRASQTGSRRPTFTDCATDSERHSSFSGSTAFRPSDLLPEDHAFIHGKTPVQTPQMLPPTPSQLRPSAVPLLWQGASPFEYRGLEAESDDETPRGTAVAAVPGNMQPLQQQQQQPSESHPIPESASKTPPLLKRNIEKTAEPQHAPKEMQSNQATTEACRAEIAAKMSHTKPEDNREQESSAGSAGKHLHEAPGTKQSKLRKLCHAFTWGKKGGGKRH